MSNSNFINVRNVKTFSSCWGGKDDVRPPVSGWREYVIATLPLVSCHQHRHRATDGAECVCTCVRTLALPQMASAAVSIATRCPQSFTGDGTSEGDGFIQLRLLAKHMRTYGRAGGSGRIRATRHTGSEARVWTHARSRARTNSLECCNRHTLRRHTITHVDTHNRLLPTPTLTAVFYLFALAHARWC